MSASTRYLNGRPWGVMDRILANLTMPVKGLEMVSCTIVTDRLASYAAAKAVALPTVAYLRRWR
jgi:hypothetical protein